PISARATLRVFGRTPVRAPLDLPRDIRSSEPQIPLRPFPRRQSSKAPPRPSFSTGASFRHGLILDAGALTSDRLCGGERRILNHEGHKGHKRLEEVGARLGNGVAFLYCAPSAREIRRGAATSGRPPDTRHLGVLGVLRVL